MARKRLEARERIRARPGTVNLYAYLGDYADVGGSRWETLGSADFDEAYARLKDRIAELEYARGRRAGSENNPLLIDFARRHFEAKRNRGKAGSTVEENERHIDRVLDFFEVSGVHDPRLSDLDGAYGWVTDFITWLKSLPGNRGDTLASQTIRNTLYSLSDVLQRAQREGFIRTNPVEGHDDIPAVEIQEATYLEVGEAWSILDAARSRDPVMDRMGRNVWAKVTPSLYEILAAFAYTGGRDQEVLGLEVEDLDFRNRRVWFRPNRIRPTLKRRWHSRWVPMWTDLSEILDAYLGREGAPVTGQLFPRMRGTGLISDLRRPMALVTAAAGVDKHVTLHTWRHTYAAFRLQTLDNGQPVSPYTVMRELGHSSWTVFQRHYAHLLDARPRYDEVAYREPKVLDLEAGRQRLRRV